MSDDLDHRLAGLAEHGHRTGRLEPASALRARGDRRRRRRYAATGTFGVVLAAALGAGIALAQPDGTTPAPVTPASVPASPAPSPSAVPSAVPSASPSGSPSSAPSGRTPPSSRPPSSSPPSSGGVLSGSRQLFVFVLDKGVEVPESVLAVTSDGRLNVTSDYGDRALLVPVPTAPGSKKYLLKTGKLRSGGEASCFQAQDNGSDPFTLVTEACDASEKDQLFSITEAGRDNQDRMTYEMSVRGLHLFYSPQGEFGEFGLILRNVELADERTTFVLIDRGKATLPTF